MPEPISCAAIAVISAIGGGGAGIGIYANRDEIRDFFVSAWRGFEEMWDGLMQSEAQRQGEEKRRIELVRINQSRERREAERMNNLDTIVLATERETKRLQEQTQNSLSVITDVTESMSSSTSIIDIEVSKLTQIDEDLHQSALKHEETMHNLKENFQKKMSQLEASTQELVLAKEKQLRDSQEELASTAKELDLAKTKLKQVEDENLQKGQALTSSEAEVKKLNNQLVLFKQELSQSKTKHEELETLNIKLVDQVGALSDLTDKLSAQLEKAHESEKPFSPKSTTSTFFG